jgi:molecular chaperone HscB
LRRVVQRLNPIPLTSFDINFTADHFTLFGLERRQGLDVAQLDSKFREVQAQVHPDRHAHGTESDQRMAMQWATRVNEGYQALKKPLNRARYLLHLLGHDAQVESNTAMPVEFLMAQMELRETVEDAKVGADETALDDARNTVIAEMKSDYRRLEQLIDQDRDYAAATALVRQLMFQEKLLHEIDEALEAVLA